MGSYETGSILPSKGRDVHSVLSISNIWRPDLGQEGLFEQEDQIQSPGRKIGTLPSNMGPDLGTWSCKAMCKQLACQWTGIGLSKMVRSGGSIASGMVPWVLVGSMSQVPCIPWIQKGSVVAVGESGHFTTLL